MILISRVPCWHLPVAVSVPSTLPPSICAPLSPSKRQGCATGSRRYCVEAADGDCLWERRLDRIPLEPALYQTAGMNATSAIITCKRGTITAFCGKRPITAVMNRPDHGLVPERRPFARPAARRGIVLMRQGCCQKKRNQQGTIYKRSIGAGPPEMFSD